MSKLVSIAVLAVAISASPLLATPHVWTGSASGLFSDAANWAGGSPAGDTAAELSFPTSTRVVIQNDLPSLIVKSISISGSGYTIYGSSIDLLPDAQVSDTSSGPNEIACDLGLGGAVTFVRGGDYINTLTLTGRIAGSGSVLKLGGGRLIYGGSVTNTYTGATEVRDGRLILAKTAGVTAVAGSLIVSSTGASSENGLVLVETDEQIANSSAVSVVNSGQLDLLATETIGPLTIGESAGVAAYGGELILGGDISVLDSLYNSSTIEGNVLLPATRTVTFIGTGYRAALRLSGLEGGPGAGLIIRQTGTSAVVTADIQASYFGDTIVQSGVIKLNDLHSAVTVTGGTFSGQVLSVNVQSGTLQQSTTAETALELNAGATFEIRRLRDPYSSVQAPSVSLGGSTLLFSEYWWPAPSLGTTDVVVSNTGTDPVVGTFAGLPEGSVLDGRFTISYHGGDGNDVTLTDTALFSSGTSIRTNESQYEYDEPITLTATVSAGIEPVGTVTFSEGATVLGSATLTNTKATITVTLPPGSHNITASYSGNPQIRPSSGSAWVSVFSPTPTITSVDPASAQLGSTANITVLGSNFLPESQIHIRYDELPTTYISSSELRGTYTLPSYDTTEPVQAELYVEQPLPGRRQSNHVTFTMTPRPAGPPSPFTFEPSAVSVKVTPSAATAWFAVGRRPVGYSTRLEFDRTILTDSDNDGTVRWELSQPVAPYGIWAVADLTTRTIVAARPDDNRIEQPRTFPAHAFLRDPNGAYSQIMLSHLGVAGLRLLWVRPGVGAWNESLFSGGGGDLDGVQNEHILVSTSAMQPVGSSPAAPADGIAAGDLFIGADDHAEFWFGDRVDDHLPESNGPGTVGFVNGEWQPPVGHEAEGPVRVTLLRTEGSDGAVTVNYATANDTALAGVHYVGSAGTVTFGAGELMKTFEIPLIDDAVYSGVTRFRLTLSDPAGTTLRGPTEQIVAIGDDEAAPTIAIDQLSVPEGDTGEHQVSVRVRLTGPTRVPATMNWGWGNGSYPPFEQGTFTFAPGETEKSVTVRYTADTNSALDRTLRVWVWDVVNATILGTGGVTVVDDDIVNLLISDATAVESAASASVTLRLSAASERLITLKYRTIDGSARGASDYTGSTGTVTFTPFATQRTITIPILPDTDSEGDEYFTIELSDAENATLQRSNAAVLIIDDDRTAAMPVATIEDITVSESIGVAQVRVRLSFAASTPLSLLYAILDGTATSPEDYSGLKYGIVTFAPGETLQTIPVTIVNDSRIEPDETLTVRLNPNAAIAIGREDAMCTIVNDDAQPVGRSRAVRH